MYLTQGAISNAAAYRIPTSLTTNISYVGRNLLQSAINFVVRYLKICLRWTARQVRQAIAALWQALGVAGLLHSIRLICLRILKWCGITLAITIGVPIVVKIGYWGLPKLLEIYSISQKRSLEERWENEERKRKEAYLSELRAKQAAEAAAKEEARLRQAREDQAKSEKQKKDKEKRQIKARADYMRWEKECDSIFQDRASMTKFPFPPLPRCAELGCPAFHKTPVPACQHNVKQFLKESGNFSLKLLKIQRRLWHEDRFASCRADLRPEFKRLANSLFVVLDPWYEDLKGKEANSSSVR